MLAIIKKLILKYFIFYIPRFTRGFKVDTCARPFSGRLTLVVGGRARGSSANQAGRSSVY